MTSVGEERANLSAFRTFVRFALLWFLSFSSSSWCLGRAAACDCGTPWTFLLTFFFTPCCFVIHFTRRFVLIRALCCFVIHLTRRFVLIRALCYFVFVFINPFSPL